MTTACIFALFRSSHISQLAADSQRENNLRLVLPSVVTHCWVILDCIHACALITICLARSITAQPPKLIYTVSWITVLASWLRVSLAQQISIKSKSIHRDKHGCWQACMSVHVEVAEIQTEADEAWEHVGCQIENRLRHNLTMNCYTYRVLLMVALRVGRPSKIWLGMLITNRPARCKR